MTGLNSRGAWRSGVRPSGVLLWALISLAGCAGNAGSGAHHEPDKAVTRVESNVADAERVELRLLTYNDPVWGELKICPGPRPAGETISDKADDPSGRPRFLAGLAVEGVSMLVGMVVDAVQAAIKAEAELHERQYRQTVYATDFWEELGKPRYAGFELSRYAAGSDKPASRLLVAFAYSESDPRMVLLKPVHLSMTASKAKVSPGSGDVRRMNVKLNTLIVGSYVNDKHVFVQENLADSTLTLGAINLDDFKVKQSTFESKAGWTGDFKYATAGFFLAPRPSSDLLAPLTEDLRVIDNKLAQSTLTPADKDRLEKARSALVESIRKYSRGGAFGVTAIVTETDTSKAREVLLKIADFVGAQRTPLINQAKELIGEKK